MSAAVCLGIVVVLSLSLVAAAHAARLRRRHRHRLLPRARSWRHEEVSLPALTEAQARQVMRDAERAAIEQALGAPVRRNPHPQGTRARILWETHRGATLLDWDEKDQWL